MKINDILLENNLNEDILKAIIDSHYFKQYFKPIIDKIFYNYYENNYYTDEEDLIESVSEEVKQSTIYKYFLFHGTDRNISNKIIKFEYRGRSVDTVPFFHNYTNDESKNTIGEPIRNLLFGTTNKTIAEDYGKIYIIIPLDNYIIYYNPKIIDFTESLKLTKGTFVSVGDWRNQAIDRFEERFNGEQEELDEILENIVDNEIDMILVNVYEYMLTSMKNLYEKDYKDLKTVILDMVKSHNYSRLLGETIFEYIYDRLEYYKNDINQYIDNIKLTTKIEDIPNKIEFMIKPERFILLNFDDSHSDNKIAPIIEYYLRNILKNKGI